ncbi:replication initiator protein A [Enterococcus faecium]|uniref:replication initiator protein A n=1 Tax=Enterococcus faecium TaxID=1352 RepID=UPI00033044CE|nr:replication initiator protein A [Enterococcus faecium]EOG08587.1 hypothetical protein SKY_01369 [Enterococcus faecium EnGen0175]
MEEIDKLIAQYAYSKDDVYAEKYLKYPIFLDKHKKYKKMKQSTKKVYMYLKKQNEYSLENSKVDSKGRIFLIFAIEKIAEKSCLTKKTVISALRELEEYKLITIKKNGFNKKTGKNNPNFYYLLKPEFSEGDFYKKSALRKIYTFRQINITVQVKKIHLPTNQHSMVISHSRFQVKNFYKNLIILLKILKILKNLKMLTLLIHFQLKIKN